MISGVHWLARTERVSLRAASELGYELILVCAAAAKRSFEASFFGYVRVQDGLIIERPLLELFRITNANNVYLLVLLTSAITNISAMFLSVFKGIQRMDKQNSIEITMSVLNVLGTVFFHESGFGMFGLALNAFLNACIGICLTFVLLKRVVPGLSLGWNFDRDRGLALWKAPPGVSPGFRRSESHHAAAAGCVSWNEFPI